MTQQTISQRIKLTLDYALRSEHDRGHDFHIADSKGKFTNESRSPSISPAGQFYLDCNSCGRSVFENGTGSAITGVVCHE